jgi:RimJ/RimL family protein N-acetyltransferase
MVPAPSPIVTERLALVPATPALLEAALAGNARLASALHAVVPASWPHRFLDDQALRYVLARLEESSARSGWWLYFVVLPEATGTRTLIGSAGYKGPPTRDGSVEIGYGIVDDRQRRGYATEAARGLIARAFSFPEVGLVVAETLPELLPSIGVLRKCGFRDAGTGSEPGVIRFELDRESYESVGSPP